MSVKKSFVLGFKLTASHLGDARFIDWTTNAPSTMRYVLLLTDFTVHTEFGNGGDKESIYADPKQLSGNIAPGNIARNK